MECQLLYHSTQFINIQFFTNERLSCVLTSKQVYLGIDIYPRSNIFLLFVPISWLDLVRVNGLATFWFYCKRQHPQTITIRGFLSPPPPYKWDYSHKQTEVRQALRNLPWMISRISFHAHLSTLLRFHILLPQVHKPYVNPNIDVETSIGKQPTREDRLQTAPNRPILCTALQWDLHASTDKQRTILFESWESYSFDLALFTFGPRLGYEPTAFPTGGHIGYGLLLTSRT